MGAQILLIELDWYLERNTFLTKYLYLERNTFFEDLPKHCYLFIPVYTVTTVVKFLRLIATAE